MTNRKKSKKCAELLEEFLLSNHGMVLDQLSETDVIRAFDAVLKLRLQGHSLRTLYEHLLEYYSTEGFQDNRHDIFMQIWYLPVHLVPRLRTDDSF